MFEKQKESRNDSPQAVGLPHFPSLWDQPLLTRVNNKDSLYKAWIQCLNTDFNTQCLLVALQRQEGWDVSFFTRNIFWDCFWFVVRAGPTFDGCIVLDFEDKDKGI